jgi:hypothetical protein
MRAIEARPEILTDNENCCLAPDTKVLTGAGRPNPATSGLFSETTSSRWN